MTVVQIQTSLFYVISNFGCKSILKHFIDSKAKNKKNYSQANKEQTQKRQQEFVNIWKTFEIKNMNYYHDLCLNVEI